MPPMSKSGVETCTTLVVWSNPVALFLVAAQGQSCISGSFFSKLNKFKECNVSSQATAWFNR